MAFTDNLPAFWPDFGSPKKKKFQLMSTSLAILQLVLSRFAGSLLRSRGDPAVWKILDQLPLRSGTPLLISRATSHRRLAYIGTNFDISDKSMDGRPLEQLLRHLTVDGAHSDCCPRASTGPPSSTIPHKSLTKMQFHD